MHCCTDKELESTLQIILKANNTHSSAKQYHHEQRQWPSLNLIVAIVRNFTKNGCLKVNVVNRSTIPISSVTTTTITSTATCLLLLKASPTPLPLLKTDLRPNFGIGDFILCVQIHFDCTATIMFLPLHQQTHCQIKKPTSVTIEMKMNRLVVNGIDSIAQSMCTNQTNIPSTNKLVETNAMHATNEIVYTTLDQFKAIKLKTTNLRRCEYDYTKRPNKMIAIKLNGHGRLLQSNCVVDNDDHQSDDSNASAFTSMQGTMSDVDVRCELHTERRHHNSMLPNKFTIVNTLYIEYRKMFCTFLLPLLLLLCNLTPLIHAGEYILQLNFSSYPNS